jgi:hypothetical protein
VTRELTLSFSVGLSAICLASSTFMFLAPATYSVDYRFLGSFYATGLVISLLTTASSFRGGFGGPVRAFSLAVLLGHLMLVAIAIGLIVLTGMPPQD